MEKSFTLDEIEYKNNYRKYMTASILDSANNKIASSAFLTAFAVYLGLSNFAIGIYAVLNIITNVFQIFAAPLFYKIGQSKKVVLTNYSIYRISSVCFAIIPFVGGNIALRTSLFFIFAFIYALTGEMGYVTFVNWRMSLVKYEDRTRFSSTKNIFTNTLVVAFTLVIGVILDYFTDNNQQLTGFLIMFALIFIIAFTDILIRIRTLKPNLVNKKVTIKETILIPAKDKDFRWIVVISALKNFADGIGMIYLNVFLLRQLNLDYIYYSVLNLLIHLAGAVFSKLWAKIAQKRKWLKLLLPMSILYVSAFVILLTLPNTALLYTLPIVFIMIGCANSAFNIFDNIAFFESAKNDYHTSYITFERFIEGLVVATIPIITIFISENSKLGIKLTFLLGAISYIALICLLIIYRKFQNEKNKIEPNDDKFESDKMVTKNDN